MPARTFLLVLALAVPAAGSPRDDLLRAIPDDYTFCLVAHGLRGPDAGGDSFYQQLAASPLFKHLRATAEARQAEQVLGAILKELGTTTDQVATDILGDAVVFCYRKGPPGQPDREDGLILLHARDDRLLGRLLDRLRDAQVRSGELKAVQPMDGDHGPYFRRVKAAAGEADDYYAVRGHRLVFSGNPDLLNATLGKLAAGGTDDPRAVRQMQALGVEGHPLVVLVNPRAFDADLKASARAGKPAEQVFLAEFGRYWAAVQGLALSVRLAPAIELGLALHVRTADLPRFAVRFGAQAGRRSPLWDRVPADPLFAAVGRIDLEALAGMLGAFLSEPDRSQVLETIADAVRPFHETDDLAPLLRGLGPDVGLWVTAPDPADRTWCPRAVLAVKRADTPEGKAAEEAALKGLDFLARLAALGHKGLRVHSESQGPTRVQYLTHPTAFPPGFRPAFAAKGGYLLAAGSPETIAGFDPPTTTAAAAEEVPVLRVSVSAWRAYLQAHRDPLAAFLARTQGVPEAEVAARLDALKPVLDSLDRIELLHRPGPDRLTLTLRLTEVRK